jgi:amino acid transporter
MDAMGSIGWTLVVNAVVSWAMAFFSYQAGAARLGDGVTVHSSTASATWTLGALGLMLLVTGLTMVGAASAEKNRLRSQRSIYRDRHPDAD